MIWCLKEITEFHVIPGKGGYLSPDFINYKPVVSVACMDVESPVIFL